MISKAPRIATHDGVGVMRAISKISRAMAGGMRRHGSVKSRSGAAIFTAARKRVAFAKRAKSKYGSSYNIRTLPYCLCVGGAQGLNM